MIHEKQNFKILSSHVIFRSKIKQKDNQIEVFLPIN